MMGWNAKTAARAALSARSSCPRHKRLLVGWNGEGENVAESVSGEFTPLQSKTTAAFNPPEIQRCIPVSLFWNFAPLRPNFEA
jgi:hypothetical protein